MKKGKPFQLAVEQGTETENRLSHEQPGVDHRFAVASTNRSHVEAMKEVIPALLDADYDSDAFTIAEVSF